MSYQHGNIMHFYEHAVEQCKKSLEKSGIKESKYISIEFYPKDYSYLIKYTPNKKAPAVAMSEIAPDGREGAIVFALAHDSENKKFGRVSRLGPNDAQEILDGKHPDTVIPDKLYNSVDTNSILPCMAIDKKGKVAIFSENSNQINWRGEGSSAVRAISDGNIGNNFGRV